MPRIRSRDGKSVYNLSTRCFLKTACTPWGLRLVEVACPDEPDRSPPLAGRPPRCPTAASAPFHAFSGPILPASSPRLQLRSRLHLKRIVPSPAPNAGSKRGWGHGPEPDSRVAPQQPHVGAWLLSVLKVHPRCHARSQRSLGAHRTPRTLSRPEILPSGTRSPLPPSLARGPRAALHPGGHSLLSAYCAPREETC